MPARRASSPRRDQTPAARDRHLVGLGRGLEQLEGRSTPAVFNATVDPGQFGANNAAAVTELLGFFAQAATNNEPDTINLFRPSYGPATYTFSSAAETLGSGANAIPSIVADGPGRNGITINGNGATITRNGGAAAFRLLRVSGTDAQTYLTLNDLTLTTGSSSNGGAVLATGGATLTVNNSTIGNNTASVNGGGVALQAGSGAVFNNAIVNGNTATADGGGVSLGSAAFLQFNNSQVINNISTNGIGGVSASAGTVEFNDSLLSSNNGKTGGGFGGTDAVFNRDTITNNSTSGTGAAGVSGPNIRVVQSYVAGNVGGSTSTGGGVQGTTVTVLSSTIDNNSTTNPSGGAGGIDGTTVTVTNSTVTNNSSFSTAKAGGIQATTLLMNGTIVSGNTSSASSVNLYQVQATGGNAGSNYNLISRTSGTAGVYTNGGNDNFQSDTTKAAVDPLLGSPQANGGPVFTRALGVGSPAINANSPSQTLATDGRGFARVVGGRADIGAFEVQTGNAVGIVTGDQQTAQTNQNFANALKVLVTDPNGTPLKSTIVRFQAPTTPSPTASAVFFGQDNVTGILSDTNGFATIPVGSLAANSTPGNYLVSASTTNGAPASNFRLRNTAFGVAIPTTGSLQIVSGNNQSTTANALFGQNLKVQVLDTSNSPIASVPVTFTAPTFTAQGSGDSTPSLTFSNGGTTITVNTDANGFVSIPVTANKKASTVPFQVEASGPNVGTVTFDLTNRPAAASKVLISSGSGQATLTNTSFSSPLQAQATDVFGNPVLANVSVTFTGPFTGAGVTFSGGAPFTTVLTNANGIASAIPTANGTGGNYFVDATVPSGTQQASFALSNIFVPPPPPPPPPPPNQNPIITDVPNQTLVNGNSGTFAFGISDAESAPSNLVVSAKSSDTTLIPSITFGGAGINRTVTINTAAGLTGTATITLTVTDEAGATANDTFDVTVTVPPPPPPPPPVGASNTPPAISDVPNQTLAGASTGQYPVVVLDAETPAANLIVTASAANTTLIPSVTVTGSGSNRVVNVTSANVTAGGTTTVTLTVRDTDGNTATDTFDVTVPPTNVPPPPPPPPVPTVPLVGVPQFAVGSGPGGSQVVRYFNADGSERFLTAAFPGLTGGVRTATGDFNGDGVADIVIGTGPGSPTQVQILNGNDGSVLFGTQPFEASFTGGVYVAAGDLNGDGKADLVVTPDEGGGPRARIYNANGFGVMADFFGIDDPNFRGGARAAIGDVNGDGRSDLVVAAGFGGGPRVAGYDGKSVAGGQPVKMFNDFFLFEPTLANGAFVAVGDVNGDGFADIVGGGGPGGGPRVLVVSGQALLSNSFTPLANFFVGDTGDRGGVRVAVKNLDNDTKADVVVGSGQGSGSKVTGFLGANITAGGTPLTTINLDTFPGFTGGVFVG